MKKLMTMVAFFAAATMLFAGCGDDDDDKTTTGAAPTIVLEGGDIDAVQEITTSVKGLVKIQAANGIANFVLTIDSPALTAALLKTVNLDVTMNFVKPATPKMAAALTEMLKCPVGDKLKGQKSVSFNVSALVPMIAGMYKKEGNHNFKVTVTDAAGLSTTKTLKFHTSTPATPAK